MQEIRSGRCEIEPILHQALAHVAPGAEVEVRLNPDDLACLRQRQDAEEQRSTDQETQRQDAEEQGAENKREEETLSRFWRLSPDGRNLVADPAVGRGECMVRTAQGVIESTMPTSTRSPGAEGIGNREYGIRNSDQNRNKEQVTGKRRR